MNFKTTAVLLLSLLIIGSYFIVIERNAPTTFQREETLSTQQHKDGTPLFTTNQLATESVIKIDLQRPDTDTITLEKENQDWHQIQPIQFPLSTWAIKELIDEAATLRYSLRFNPTTTNDDDLPSLQEAALDPPQATLSLTLDKETPTTQTIHIGKTAIGGRTYAKINDDPHIYVVNNDLRNQILEKDLTDWRKTSIDVPTPGQIGKITLTNNDQTFSIHNNSGNWFFSPPNNGRVDTQAVEKLVGAFNTLYIRKFIADQPEDLSIYGLDAPTNTVSLYAPIDTTPTTQPAQTQPSQEPKETPQEHLPLHTLNIGAPADLTDEQVFTTWSHNGSPENVVFTIAKSDTDKFNKSIDDLRDPRVTPLTSSDIRELTVQRPTDTYKLLRTPTGWSFGDPNPGFDVDTNEASSLVQAITTATAKSFESNSTTTNQPLVTVTLAAIGQPQPDLLQIYPPNNSTQTHPVRRNDESVLYHVPTEPLERIMTPVLALRERTVLATTPNQVKRIMIEQPDGVRYIFEQNQNPSTTTDTNVDADADTDTTTNNTEIETDQIWTLIGHESFETPALRELVDLLFPLKAENWIEMKTQDDALSPQPHQVTVHFTTSDSNQQTLSIDLSRRCGSLPGVTDDNICFELNSRLIELLQTEFANRTLLPFTVNEIASVTMVTANDSVTITRNDTGNYITNTNATLDQSAAGTLFDTLAGLRTQQYITPQHILQPPLKIELTTTSGQTHRLAFASTDQPNNTVTNGDQWFTLDAQTIEKLHLHVVSTNQEEPEPTNHNDEETNEEPKPIDNDNEKTSNENEEISNTAQTPPTTTPSEPSAPHTETPTTPTEEDTPPINNGS